MRVPEAVEPDASTASERPCIACPWVSRDERDRTAVADPDMRAAMEAGAWFCCHVNLGTCHGARLLHEKHLKRQGGAR